MTSYRYDVEGIRIASIEDARDFLVYNNVNAVDPDGLTPLLHSIINGNLELVKFLIGKGACVDYQDRAGWTPLLFSIRCNHVHIAMYLIREISVDVNVADNSGRTPLMCAITGYHTNIAKLLIYRGADIHIIDNDGENALSLSTKAVMSNTRKGDKRVRRTAHQDCDCEKCKSHSIIANLLLQRGADIDPFSGSYASRRATDANIFSYLFNCINVNDSDDPWSLPDAHIPNTSPSLSFLTSTTPSTDQDSHRTHFSSDATTNDPKNSQVVIKKRTKSGDSTITKSSSGTTTDEMTTAEDDDDGTIADAELDKSNDWSLCHEPDIDDTEEDQHEQVAFLQKMRRQYTFYGVDDDFYSGGSGKFRR